ncbi:BcPKS12, polyketide synthase [Cadophora sp. MPI-SDFR-AT-0126]|nr:BcPKS12, polyketide synthase [Leotiomycetes sp. MPI-SDFR-AT-0126]
MAENMAFLLFGDQTLDIHGFLADFLKSGNPSILTQSFIDNVGTALRAEVDQLSTIERQRVPHFSSIKDLNNKYHARDIKNAAVDSALLCITQIAHYIDCAEKMHEDTRPSETSLVGLCTGLFAAAAISSAPSLSGLVPVAVQVVLMAFRTGAYVATLADCLQGDAEISQSWTYVIPALEEAETSSILNDFHKENNIPLASQAFVSATTATSVTISGPPFTLKTLFGSDAFDTKPLSIPIHGPYHAPHLFSRFNAEKILQLGSSSVQRVLGNLVPRHPILSCATGTWYSEQTAVSLIKTIVRDILANRQDFQKVLHACVVKAQEFKGSKCLVVPYGLTKAANSLTSMLKAQTDLEIIQRQPLTAEKQDNSSPKDKVNGPVKLAIVGMAGRFPDAASHEKLWELLEKGLDVHRVVPKDRFNAETHCDPTGKATNTSHTPYGCWIENPGLFDPRFFNMSPREAFQTDPMQRMALSTAYEALEMSGYIPNRTRSTKLDRIGTFYGQTSDDWREINAAQEIDTYFITGGVRAFGPGRINYHFGFSGPSFNIDTACSSSAAAMQLACTSLVARECDTAIVGGLSCMTNSDIFAGLSRGQFLSKKGPCATFDNDADGYCRADGVGTVIVKRLDDALAEKDNILAVILGTATNHSADAISITHPHGGTQEILYKSILDKAGIDALDVDYVEMHGTGTQAGDGTEMKSVTNVFAPADRKRTTEQRLFLGTVKSNVGHGEAASGVTALIKCLMMLKNNAIPPHVGIKGTINQGFPKDLAERQVHIAFHKTPLRKRPGVPRRIFINNFSAAGGNTGLLLEEGPAESRVAIDPRSTHIITVTAKSKSAMIRNAERYIAYLEQNPDTSIADLAYTTTARKIQYNWRVSVTASDIKQVKAGLKAKLGEKVEPVLPVAPKVAFLFTGQGSHYAALGKDFYVNSTLFKETIDEFDSIAAIHGFPSFFPLIDGSVEDVTSLSPIIVQIGVVCLEMAIAKLWDSWGIKPSVVLGHSLGEYAALNVSGILSSSDVIYLVGKRAEILLEKCTPGTDIMVAVQGSVASIAEALGNSPMNIACINGIKETVLSGAVEEMAATLDLLKDVGFKCTHLKVPFAFHSAQVDPILDNLQMLAESIHFGKAKVPLISSVLGRMLNEPEVIDAKYLKNHARNPVDFLGGIQSAQQSGFVDSKTVWIEVGPHPVCSGMVKGTFGPSTLIAPTLRKGESPYKTLASSLSTMHTAGLNIDWNEYHRDFNDCVHLLDLPTYSFDDKNYWIQYEGDWCLTKGKRPALGFVEAEKESVPKLSTTSIHSVISETVEGGLATVITESDLAKPGLREVVSGHVVNGSYLTPSSLYADMAYTTAEYAYRLIRPDATDLAMDAANMKVVKPLIAPQEEGKTTILTLTTEVNIAAARADLKWTTGSGKSLTEHAVCNVFFAKCNDYLSDWTRTAYLIQSRIDWLKAAEITGEAHKIGRGLAYKLFAAMVDYNPKFRGMEQVILDSKNFEATATIKFQTKPEDGNFKVSPYWIDSLAHLSGFILNASDAVDTRENAYISHGWESWKIAEPISADKNYRSYVKMQDTEPNVKAGDVYIFDGGRIVAAVMGLKFQCIPRKVLNIFLPPIGSAVIGAGKPGPVRQQITAPKPSAASKPARKTEQVSMTSIATVNKKLIGGPSVTTKVLEILATEVGVEMEELVDNIGFVDLGVDSLMSLTVSGRIREEMDLDIASHDFNDYPTIGEFKKFLSKFETQQIAQRSIIIESTENSSTTSGNESTSDEIDSNLTTPLEEPSEDERPSSTGDQGGLIELIRTTIAEEMGVDTEEIPDTVDLSTLGMDSLMSLTILGRLRETTDLDLSGDLLTVNTTIGEIRTSLGLDASPPAPEKVVLTPPVPVTISNQVSTTISRAPPTRLASSVLLQGSLKTCTRQLWLIPDGGGSATSYVDIPNLSPQVAVMGLNSPYMKVPEEYNIGVVGMAASFIIEMKRRQPTGPYMLAGWSAGGVIAFEAVNQLTKNGDEVDKLILIDSPCPDIIEPLPASLHRWFASIGLLGDGDTSKLPKWLLPHFAASVNALSNYTAEKIDPIKSPQVTAIWCEDGVCKLPTDPRPDPFPYGHAQFLLDNRTDFGPNIWDKYLNPDKFITRHMPGNHFSMMKKPYVKLLGDILREAALA